MKRVIHTAKDGYQTLEIHGTEVRSTRVQDTDPYYAQNQRLQGLIPKQAVAKRWSLPLGQIPFADYQKLVKRNPELRSKDASVKTKAWLKLLRVADSSKFRTVTKNLIPDSMTPDRGSIILPSKHLKETQDAG